MKILLLFSVLLISYFGNAQKIDSIYFHLYTDSLKKGVHNYINVDGKTSEGRWLPLTAKEIQFSSNYGKFDGNDLILPIDFKEEKLTVKAVLKRDTALTKEITIWIKQKPDDENLPTADEILNRPSPKRRRG
ncbi:MAG: hypothetical protein QM764_20025 [Chitinophagaceae bacterium]